MEKPEEETLQFVRRTIKQIKYVKKNLVNRDVSNVELLAVGQYKNYSHQEIQEAMKWLYRSGELSISEPRKIWLLELNENKTNSNENK